MIKRFFKDIRGYAMPYTVMLITLVSMPMLIISTEMVRMLFVDVHLQSAVDSACTAASQNVDIEHFILTGEVMIDVSAASAAAQSEFDGTITYADINQYSPTLSAISIVDGSTVYCNASAVMTWMLPGISPVTLTASSAAQAEARR